MADEPSGFALSLTGAAVPLKRWLFHRLRRHPQSWRFNFTVRVRYGNRQLHIPLLGGAGYSNLDAREGWLFELLGRLLTLTGGAFVDVGANVGQTLIKLKLLDPARPYFGFEPSPACATYLQRLIDRNQFERCTVLPAAISTEPGVVTLLSKGEVDPSASIVPGFREAHRYSRAHYVPALNGDGALTALRADLIGIVKIDVEGGELEVLRGLARIIRRDRPFIACEILPVFDPSSVVGRLRVERQGALQDHLRSLGYSIYRISSSAPPQPLDSIEIHSNLALSNYVFVHADSRTAFEQAFATFPHRGVVAPSAARARDADLPALSSLRAAR